jgi:predicted Zn-dependent protease
MTSQSSERLSEARQRLESGEEGAARLILLEILQGEPQNQAALLMLGGAYFSQQKYAEAEMIFTRLISLAPGNGRFSIALFNALWKQGRQQEAAEEIQRFIAAADKEAERETLAQYAELSRTIAGLGGGS